MILTVTLATALDVTYRVPRVQWNDTNRVQDVTWRAGGKGLNVARLLGDLGHEVVVAGLAGGATGATVRAGVTAAGLVESLTSIAGETRRTVAVVESGAGQVTMFTERGPHVTPNEWGDFTTNYRALLRDASVAVLSGSLPPGVGEDAYARLAAEAADAGVPVILDADGPPLREGAQGRPAIVKPNAAELARATGSDEPAAGARVLRERGAEAVVVSLGAEGLLASTADGLWRAFLPQDRVANQSAATSNPTGAGDASVAALAAGLVLDQPWRERLVHAVALSAAAVLAPLAGQADLADYDRLLSEVRVESG